MTYPAVPNLSAELAKMRVDYQMQALRRQDVEASPFAQFSRWLNEAVASRVNEPNAMTLATIDAGRPDARVVLLKGFDERGMVFFTNYHSRKGEQLAANPSAALVFWWAELQRQVRIRGQVSRTTEQESDAYFALRPRSSQIGAAASDQSRVIDSREFLEKRFEALDADGAQMPIARPVHWGGYRVAVEAMEFWQGRQSRLHDRIEYVRGAAESWNICRLSP